MTGFIGYMIDRKPEQIIAFTGGIISLISTIILAYIFISKTPSMGDIVFLFAIMSVIFSILAVISSFLVKTKPRLSGWLMICSAFFSGMFLSTSLGGNQPQGFPFLSGLSFTMLLIAGLMSLIRK